MAEWLSYPFVQRAVLSGVLLSALAGLYGVFAVQRRESFLGAGLGHAAFGGVAAGLFLGVQPLLIAVPFTVLVGAGIHVVRRYTRIAADTAIGIFFSVSVALGILLLALRPGASTDAFTYLFGSILGVTTVDVAASAGLAVLGALAASAFWGHWAYATFDEEAARADGHPVDAHNLLLIVLIALTVVLSVKVVGVLLVAAWLVIPAAAARLLSRSFSAMTTIAVAVAVGTTCAGLAASFAVDVPSGPAIIIVQAIVFAVAAAGNRS